MARLIAQVTGIITSAKLEEPAEDMKLRDPEKWVDLKQKNKLPKPYYEYSIDQHTGEDKPFQFKIKEYDISKSMLDPFSNFDETCILSSWSFKDGRDGISVKPTDLTVKRVNMSFDEPEESKKLKKVG